MSMQANVGKSDAVIRYIVGIVLLAGVVLIDNPWRWLGLLGLVPIVTAAINFCPVWRLFGIDTRGHGPHSPAH